MKFFILALISTLVSSLTLSSKAQATIKLTSLPGDYRVGDCQVPNATTANLIYANELGRDKLKVVINAQGAYLPVKVITIAPESALSFLKVNDKVITVFIKASYSIYSVTNEYFNDSSIQTTPFKTVTLGTSVSGQRVRIMEFDSNKNKNFECVLYR